MYRCKGRPPSRLPAGFTHTLLTRKTPILQLVFAVDDICGGRKRTLLPNSK
jgi:hypothetical protein